MNVILDEAHVEQFKDKYTLLELDSFRVDHDKPPVTAWCVIETIPIMEMNLIDSQRQLHHELLSNYRKRNWDFCEQAIDHLNGKWNGEVDSFYVDLHNRIQKFKEQELSAEWDGIIDKTA